MAKVNIQTVSFILKGFKTLLFSSLYQAYEVIPSVEWFFIEQKALQSHLPTHIRVGPNGHSYVSFRYKL